MPIILISNRLPYNYNTESFRTRVHEMHFFSDCPPLEPGRLASTLFACCVEYYLVTLPDGDGINNPLGKELVSDAERAMLEIRTGESFVFGPLCDIARLRQEKGLVAHLRCSYEVFGLSVDIEFPQNLRQWEKRTRYWEAAYKSLNPNPLEVVSFSSTPTVSERNRSSASSVSSTTVNTSVCPRKEVASSKQNSLSSVSASSTTENTSTCSREKVDPEEGFFANYKCYSESK